MILIAVLVVAAVYWPVRHGEFIYDDKGIDEVTFVRYGNVREALGTSTWRHLGWASLAWNVSRVGACPFGTGWSKRHLAEFHWTNVGLHAGAVLVLWRIW